MSLVLKKSSLRSKQRASHGTHDTQDTKHTLKFFRKLIGGWKGSSPLVIALTKVNPKALIPGRGGPLNYRIVWGIRFSYEPLCSWIFRNEIQLPYYPLRINKASNL
jgi:hypothetical protein